MTAGSTARLIVPTHPSWCTTHRDGIHYSSEIPPWGSDRVIYAGSSLFRMDGLPVPLVGVNLRLYAADLVEDYPLDLDQARILAWSLRRLVRRATA
ncbi:hypothetical protein [Micromonospora chokoriensis]|uniref:Uncharacterized protein n=1 Tax=Micromonospora chokoriensis TaxID=356851 RepID=A0A1C4UDA9_9ACTN|nr:hypothetical protein [Micromonospora chokoriensis]SCE69637.1 hypothetical protein GA0070612_0311 [Micromonospora chokoriensis]